MNRLPVLIFALLLIPATAWGASTMRTGEMVSITPDQVVEDDFYSLGESVVISGAVTGDLLAATGDLTVNGKIGADLAVLAGRVSISGTAGDDVRAIAGEVTIDGEINGDLVVIANSLKVLPTAIVKGDILFFGYHADISGAIGGDILGSNESMRIDGSVAGGVDVRSINLIFGEKAVIGKDVKYTSLNTLVRAQNAQITGNIIHNDPIVSNNNPLKDALIPMLVLLFATLVWYLFFRNFLERVVAHSNDHAVRSALIGFGIIFLTPIAALILIASALGSLFGVTLFIAYMLLILTSLMTVGIVAGAFITKLYSKSNTLSIVTIVIGVLAVSILAFIPLLGLIVLIGIFLISLGSLTTTLYRLLRNN